MLETSSFAAFIILYLQFSHCRKTLLLAPNTCKLTVHEIPSLWYRGQSVSKGYNSSMKHCTAYRCNIRKAVSRLIWLTRTHHFLFWIWLWISLVLYFQPSSFVLLYCRTGLLDKLTVFLWYACSWLYIPRSFHERVYKNTELVGLSWCSMCCQTEMLIDTKATNTKNIVPGVLTGYSTLWNRCY